MTETNPTTARRFHWRRFIQFRLRTLLILTTIIAILLGWWSHKARQQREAVAAVQAARGRIQYDFQNRKLKEPPRWPKWLVSGIGVDYFANVHGVDLVFNRQITDAGLENLGG